MMIGWLQRQWFLLSLLGVIVLGFCFPTWFIAFADARSLRNVIVAAVLFVMALPLDTHSIGKTLKNPRAAIMGSIVNMVLLPVVAWALSRLLVGDMRTGLLVAAAVPSTLASGAVWTRRAGGDDTVAILVTAITNLLCFVVTPFWLFVTTGSEMAVEHAAELARMPVRLAILVVVPMGLAQLLRQHKSIGAWASHQKPSLSWLAQVGILSIVLAGAAKCGSKLSLTESVNIPNLLAMCVVALVLHLGVLWLGLALSAVMGFAFEQQIAIAISGSQKTLMVGLDIAIQYFGGLAIIPMVAYHFIQLTADTIVADRLRSKS